MASLRRRGYLDADLVPGASTVWRWSCDGEVIYAVRLTMIEDAVMLSGAKWQETIELDRLPCRFGGTRALFVCPCGRAVVKLYVRAGRFRCRRCAGLVYQSQRERAWYRALRRAAKVRARIGAGPGMAEIPERPKGMWRRTYDRAVAAIEDADFAITCVSIQDCSSFLGAVFIGQRSYMTHATPSL